jgi:hypothetical protein
VNGKIVATAAADQRRAARARPRRRLQDHTPDGVTIYYQPHAPGVGYSVQGSDQDPRPARSLGKMTAADVERAFRNLETVGLETREATKQDMELLYLRKVAFKEKLELGAQGRRRRYPSKNRSRS